MWNRKEAQFIWLFRSTASSFSKNRYFLAGGGGGAAAACSAAVSGINAWILNEVLIVGAGRGSILP